MEREKEKRAAFAGERSMFSGGRRTPLQDVRLLKKAEKKGRRRKRQLGGKPTTGFNGFACSGNGEPSEKRRVREEGKREGGSRRRRRRAGMTGLRRE